ncbi:SGNH/GDSL hydrolase family protein [Xylanimonas protaetiae]|uniref:Lipase n=1 Tax=Xylanimonas protaetiae TaxID=2509457 RepID=A0A4V0YFX7_9MICO|nr:SGNH/GDSL hydrolase family protein [Xylanimonas protaetiae]QAY69251.1 lipase [Xylanimonas protaetiae]
MQSSVSAAFVHGAVEIEVTAVGVRAHRLPAWARARGDAQLKLAEAQPAGVRLAFATTAQRVALTALATRFGYAGVPPRAPGVFDAVVDGSLVASHSLGSAVVVTLDMATGRTTTSEAEPETLVFDLGPSGPERHVEIWLPHTESVELVALEADAPLRPVAGTGRTWLHHGSSISQGSNAATPTGTWASVAARAARVDLVNLGFGGSSLLDPFVARVMRDTPADLVSLAAGINIVNSDLMRRRAFTPAVHGFLDTVRDGHPDTPLLVMTPILCPIHEETPGPGAFDVAALAEGVTRFRATGDPAEVAAGKLTLQVVRAELERVVKDRKDPHLHLVDGLTLYGPDDVDAHPLPDSLHPDAETHRLIGERFTETVFGAGGAFAGGPFVG